MPPTTALQELLRELEKFGGENEAAHSERSRRMLNITRDTGEFLVVLVKAMQATRILEIGTSNGYSTLWLASACEGRDARVTTLELAKYKIDLARENFRRSEMADRIELKAGDAGDFLRAADTASSDFIFLDSERSEYVGWWSDIERVLMPGGLLVVDNATSHPEQLSEFFALVRRDGRFDTSLVPVGNGEFLAFKSRRRGSDSP